MKTQTQTFGPLISSTRRALRITTKTRCADVGFAIALGLVSLSTSAYAQAQAPLASPPAPTSAPPDAQGQPLAEPNLVPVPQPVVPVAVTPLATLRHAPRVMSLTAGYVYAPVSYLPVSLTDPIGTKYRHHGLRIDWKAGWQVGGFVSGWHSYVGFFAGFFYQFGGTLADSLGLNYGIFAKHTVFPGKRVRPFLAYGLGATQVWVRELAGRGIGHVTRLSLGIDTKVSERVAIELELAYQFNILANFAIPPAEPRSHDFHTLSVTTGIWYGR